MNTQTQMAINFWQEVNDKFPHPNIPGWIIKLQSGKVDWFRNGGLGLEAIDINSRNKYGRLNLEKWEENKKRLMALAQKYKLELQS